MSYSVEILVDDTVDVKMLEALEKATITSLEMLSVPSASLSLLLTDDTRIHQLNHEYRGIDAPTDVLSFEANIELPDDGQLYLGDIAISVPYAERQAQKRGHLLVAELQLLTVHGLLHLLGYDHFDQDERDEMWAIQEKILNSIGLYNIAPTQ